MANHTSKPSERRRGAVRRRDVPGHILQQLERGNTETVNLMEWLAVDMGALCRNVAEETSAAKFRAAFLDAAEEMEGEGVTGRLKVAGAKLARAARDFRNSAFSEIAEHRSDLIRQMACYAVNDPGIPMDLLRRLRLTEPFAQDSNMSVREAAWMAFRPHLALELEPGLRLLKNLAAAGDHNLRRFSIEVCRPRSVWGAHIDELKQRPHMCIAMLNRVRRDDSRYVRLAVGNWLNDASKTCPDWVARVCERWMSRPDPRTAFIVKRALRTIASTSASRGAASRGRRSASQAIGAQVC